MCYATCGMHVIFFFFKQKTAYEMRISDWSSDVCSSDLAAADRRSADADSLARCRRLLPDLLRHGCLARHQRDLRRLRAVARPRRQPEQIGSASCRERVCKYV